MWCPFWTLLLEIILRDLGRNQNRIMRIIQQRKIWHSSSVVDLYVITFNIHIYQQLHFTLAGRIEMQGGTLVSTTLACFSLMRVKTNLTLCKTCDTVTFGSCFQGCILDTLRMNGVRSETYSYLKNTSKSIGLHLL